MHAYALGDDIKSVSFFIDLGSNVASTEADVKARTGKAWGALDGLNDIWKSALSDDTSSVLLSNPSLSMALSPGHSLRNTKLMQVSISSITIPLRTPGDLHKKFAPTLGLLHPSFFPGGEDLSG